MRSEPRLINAGRVLADVGAAFAAFGAAFLAYEWLIHSGLLIGRTAPLWLPYMELCAIYAVLLIAVGWRLGLYPPRASVLNLWETRTLLKAVAISAAFFLSAIFVFKLEGNSRIVTLGALALVPPLMLVERRIFTAVLKYRRRSGSIGTQVLIVGSGETGKLLMKKVLDAPQLGYSLAGFLDSQVPAGTEIRCSTDQATLSVATRRVLGTPDDLEAVARVMRIEEILVDEARLTTEQTKRVLDEAARLGIRVGVVPDFMQQRADQFYLEDLSAVPVLRPHSKTRIVHSGLVKRAMDVAGASLLLVATSPIWTLSALFIRFGSTGPVLFRHQRIGLRGRPFDILKFRTMYVDTDPYAVSPEGDRDRRITPFGRLLRSTGLDELPQLWNVLRGDMSLVGPRPEMPFIVETYNSIERLRLEAKPGITGLWQLSPDRHQQIHENLEYDLYYLNHYGPLLDVLLLLETVFVTVEIAALKVFGRGQSIDEGPGESPIIDQQDRADRYVLVALDQRIAQTGSFRWKQGLQMALGTAEPYPVKFLASTSNQPQARDVISDAKRWAFTSATRIDCVPVGGPGDVQSFVDRAAVVVTDLPDVATLAEERGKRILKVETAEQTGARSPISRIESLPTL